MVLFAWCGDRCEREITMHCSRKCKHQTTTYNSERLPASVQQLLHTLDFLTKAPELQPMHYRSTAWNCTNISACEVCNHWVFQAPRSHHSQQHQRQKLAQSIMFAAQCARFHDTIAAYPYKIDLPYCQAAGGITMRLQSKIWGEVQFANW
jgi:hypothetical protein